MIIVSQDRSVIVNLDNVITIQIDNKETNKKIYVYNIDSRLQVIIGKYDTEERAMEVLQEIVEQYKGYNDNKVYEMPEE